MNIAVIPARVGSKRIPKKNIKPFNGKPMLAWTIETAITTELFDHVVVSTDNEEIAEIAVRFGAVVPFVRPAELADDVTPTVPVIAHAVRACAEMGWLADYVCCLYPCAPFTTYSDLMLSFKMLKETGAEYVYPVVEYPHPVQRAMLRDDKGRMTFERPEFELVRTQDIPKTYHDAGQFYWGKSSAWTAMTRMHSQGLGFVVPSWRMVDIDTSEDWQRAELLYRLMKVS